MDREANARGGVQKGRNIGYVCRVKLVMGET